MIKYTPNSACPYQVGAPIVFVPSAFAQTEQYGGDPGIAYRLHGRIIDVNERHRHYTVEAVCNGYRLRESFKF